MGTRGRGLGPAFTPRTRPTGVPTRKRKRHPRHHHVTTVPSTGSFLAPRSGGERDEGWEPGTRVHATHGRPTGVPPRKRKRRPRHHRVTTVSSTGNFLAPRSARRSDASQTQPGGRRAEACGAEGRYTCGALRSRRWFFPGHRHQPSLRCHSGRQPFVQRPRKATPSMSRVTLLPLEKRFLKRSHFVQTRQLVPRRRPHCCSVRRTCPSS